MPALYCLFESASGYALLEAVETADLSSLKAEVQAAVTDLARFSKMVKLKAFQVRARAGSAAPPPPHRRCAAPPNPYSPSHCPALPPRARATPSGPPAAPSAPQPFTTAENALTNINDVSEGIVNGDLKAFLEAHVPRAKPGKEAKVVIGVIEPRMGAAIQDGLGLSCVSNEGVTEVIRGVRQHFAHYVGALAGGNLEKAQLGLAHSYSRAKVKFNVNKSDNMIIQAIALLDQLDKDLNTFSMRCREWYSWHFPELGRIVKDNLSYARAAEYIGKRDSLTEDRVEGLTAILLDEDMSRAVYEAGAWQQPLRSRSAPPRRRRRRGRPPHARAPRTHPPPSAPPQAKSQWAWTSPRWTWTMCTPLWRASCRCRSTARSSSSTCRPR